MSRLAQVKCGRVHLWMRAIGASGRDVEECVSVLVSDEMERAERFRFEKHRNRFVRGRAFLRETVAAFCDCEPSALVVSIGEDGKPVVRDSPVAFNLSHSGDVAVLGVASMSEIGVDVERFDRSVEYIALARRYFAPSEVSAMEALDKEDVAQRELFFRLWTSKEAAMKATGEGLRIDPRLIEVRLNAERRPASYDGRYSSWHLVNEDRRLDGVTVSVAAPESFDVIWESDVPAD